MPTPTPSATGTKTQRRVIAYLRVSTVSQDLDNQRHGVLEYLGREGLAPYEFVEETVSGRTAVADRDLHIVVEQLGAGDVLVVAELSRLGRNMIEIMTLIDTLVQRGIVVHAVKGGHRLDGSLQAKVLSMVLVMAAEIERELISQRTKEALARRKASGQPVGRPRGSFGPSKLDRHETEIRELLGKGVSKAAIARIFSASWPTVDVFCRRKQLA